MSFREARVALRLRSGAAMKTTAALVAIAIAACASAPGPGAPDATDPPGPGAIDAPAVTTTPDARTPAMDAGPGPASAACGAGATQVATWTAPWNVTMIRALWTGSSYMTAVVVQADPSATEGTPSLYVMRMGADGALVPGSARAIGSGIEIYPRLAWSGSELAVVYERDIPNSRTEIHFARVDAAGEPIAGSDRVVSSEIGYERMPAVAWDPVDRQWAVAWNDGYDQPTDHVRLARVDAAGALVPGSEIQIDQQPGEADIGFWGSPLAWAGDRFVLTWTEGTLVHVSAITGAGAVSTPFTVEGAVKGGNDHLSGYVVESKVAVGESGYAVTWLESDSLDRFFLHVARGDAGGYVAGSNVILDPGQDSAALMTSMIWNGREYAIQWTRYADEHTKLARLTASGAPIETLDFPCTQYGDFNVDLASSGTDYALVYPVTSVGLGYTLLVSIPPT